MESAPEKSLTLEEKTKLKERLVLLKKEYNKTVHRLQRSQRAERVKTHVKKTIEEQNRLLSQELSNQDSGSVITGLLIDTNNVSGKVTESTQDVDTTASDKERKPSVSFNLDPEILHGDKRSPSCSGSESSSHEPGATSKTEASGSPNPNQCKRSRLRLNRSVRRVCSESVSLGVQARSTVHCLKGQNNVIDAASTRGSMSLTKDEALKINAATFHSISENTRRVQVSPECKSELGVDVLNNMEAINAPASPVFKKEDVPTTLKLSSENIEHLYPERKDTLDTGQSQEITTDSSPGDQYHSTNKATHCNTSNTHQSPMGDQAPSVTKFLEETSQDLLLDLSPVLQVVETSSTSPPCSENYSLETAKYQGELSLKEEERSPLDSCTLVEGLLFPVEYYVRTTRRMTSCQRKVDLEAVIHSHLGTARKGTRGRPRRASICSAPSPQVIGTPIRTPSRSATRSRRGRGRKSCPASMSSGLNNISMQLKFGSDINQIADGSLDVKETSERKHLSFKTGSGNQHMEEGLKKVDAVTLQSEERRAHSIRTQEDGSLGLHALTNNTGKLQGHVYNLRTSRETHEPSSPFHLFSSGHNLHYLLRRLDITDFHLPDEDFGLLKLEKLKSASQLEPAPTKEKIKYRRAYSIDSITAPATDNSALLHGAAGVCTYVSQRNIKLLPLNKGWQEDDRNRATLGDRIPLPTEAIQHDGGTSQTFLTRETPEVFHLPPSEDNNDTCAPGSPEQAPCDTPQCSADWERTLEVSEHVSQALCGSLDPGSSTVPKTNSVETLREGFIVSSTYMESTVAINKKQSPNVLSATKELTCSVLLSTSMCSVPVDTPAECVSPGRTPGLPTLGSTPAVFMSGSPAPCEEQTSKRTIDFLPEESEPLNNEAGMVAQDDVDTDQYSEVLLPPSGDVAQVCVEKKPCSHLECEGNAPRSDRCDTEGMLGGDRLRLVSEIKDTCGGGCPVDLCSVWWEFSGCKDLCIVSASEYWVCLWRPQEACKWKCVQTWNFTEMPVIQILPLFQEKNMVCVTLGNLEIMEIWVLSSHPEMNTWEKQLVKRGHTKTAQGLSRHRVVGSSGGGDSQVVELWQLSDNGSVVGSHTLVAPKDSVVAFSEVDGERDALVGSTVDNNLVLWNSVTGHLLRTFHIGNLCSDLACISATSDSGLLFLVVGSLFSKPCEISGSCIFRLIATNPQGGASAFIMSYTLPEGLGSRYLEGDVKKQRAAAVLTCGSIAFWDLSRSHCSAVLPPDSNTPWCLVRWGNRPSCLLAGRKDGTICVFEYTQQAEMSCTHGVTRAN